MRRGCSLDSELFGEPAWDMLLDLYAAALEGRRLSVSSSCLAAGVPPTTALRWQRLLVERELVERVPDLEDNKSEEQTSELQSLMRTSYALFCLKKKRTNHLLTTCHR